MIVYVNSIINLDIITIWNNNGNIISRTENGSIKTFFRRTVELSTYIGYNTSAEELI